MKKLVLASAAALVLAGAVAGTGTVRANSSRYNYTGWNQGGYSWKYLRLRNKNPYSRRTLTEDYSDQRKNEAKDSIKELSKLSDKEKKNFADRIDALTDTYAISSILSEAKNKNNDYLEFDNLLQASKLKSQAKVQEIKDRVYLDEGYSARQGINDLKSLEN
ncbi:TPA: hypothetical protein TT917_000982 [Streptococcus equi subsp. zooepidemicus]|uniref:Anti-phagocytic factor H binding protein n=1 Tax=Streptococcus equi subsp. ruminatorum CECT 5772 TaxID=1051981 RepID=A0A922T593_9STRE|nr:GA module-containing protein [Streptococcus equi]HEL1011690.1 hypothetical protein [Streptococcus equi subsp. ruminatorum]KED04224.1 anti-phagocytic factor H binding protein [Streptococcus equi subsp. ruminatorum CECT 5772]MCD3369917.1 GA module-containing protein [Streptococcus equi subsp. zooepidemicus]MCD3380334.1 GA module-containing protein [Streptococcus equi subsp. zooepidemicus]QTZ56154.1 hypothetical protein JFMEOBDD_00202 [Streptococcus equi subsp. zooepidemicus]